MTLARIATVASFAILLSACASGPKLAEMQSSIPALKSDQGRIYFFRSSNMIGAGIQPNVMLNGEVVGVSKPGGFFFVDHAPGAKQVTTTSEVEKKLTFNLNAGEIRYVKTSVGLGMIVYRVYPELVDKAVGEKDVAELSYIGKPLSSAK